MCIRDSYNSGSLWVRVGQQQIAWGEAYFFRVFDVPNGLDTCLLYTSDAADERSSVDLGGRRILKKKKNEPIICGANVRANTRRGKT